MTPSEQPQLIAAAPSVASFTDGPTVAVVIASRGARSWLAACLSSLIPQCLRAGTDLVVVRADTPTAIMELSGAYPYVRFIFAPPRTGTADLRSAGLAGVGAAVVTFLDDSDDQVVPDEHWLGRIRWTGERSGVSGGHEATRRSGEVGADGGVSAHAPCLSVVVPAHQAADSLRHSLEALSRSRLPRRSWELIVVDDASSDQTGLVAAQFADTVIRLPGVARGPAYARNRGFEFARGGQVVFINADVCVHRDTLTQFMAVLDEQPDVSAVFGSYDAHPAARGLVSQYRNLLLHYYQQQSHGETETFWASCAAIRRTAFVEAGMFDEWHFPRRQIEDVELGLQLRRRGHRILSRPDTQATHLRRWRLTEMISADLQDRMVPWMRVFHKQLVATRRRRSGQRRVKNANTTLTWIALGASVAALVGGRPGWLLVSAASLIIVGVNDRRQHRFFVRERGHGFALATIPLRLLGYLVNGLAITLGWVMGEIVGEPTPNPSVEAYAEVGVRMWPPVPVRRSHRALEPRVPAVEARS